MLTVIWVELLMDGELPVFHVPDPVPTPHLNWTTLPLWKLLPLIVRVCDSPSAVIAVGLMLLTDGTGTVAVTATDWVPDEQSEELVALEDRQTRTERVSFTVPGFMLTVIWVELLMDGELPVFHVPEPVPTPHLNWTTLPLWKLL